MSDRSDEVTESRDPAATDDLLEETDRLLSESDADVGGARAAGDAAGNEPSAPIDDPLSDSSFGSGTEVDRDAEPAADDGDDSRSWLAPVTSRLSLGRYFSPKEYLALVALLGTGLLGGATVLPVAGRLIGMFAVAFFVGLVASKRRYLEVGIAGVSVGGVAAVLNNAVLAAVGSGQSLVAVGATVGLLAAVVGYYFGRDLRDGLARDV
ncbi:hypothetical protein A6E15_12385 [Natrinema saccharevitans]|uniref:DUF456 domain-containing protein n=1 Tax=Natrinema saccharevitans TaxID=301967 RepID=A0A1S8AYM3_9EURY|nr:hypothetical protein [Natrinema saccharevitans]OLZ41732.1 hypothetical protein A6E15_12385 [Natrinema saccharevitans]